VKIGRGVTNSIHLFSFTKEVLQGFGDFKIGGQVIFTVKCADNVVLLAKEEMVLYGMTDKLTEIGRYYRMEMNVEKTKVMRISRQPSLVQIKNKWRM
jgi:hypothetical protein